MHRPAQFQRRAGHAGHAIFLLPGEQVGIGERRAVNVSLKLRYESRVEIAMDRDIGLRRRVPRRQHRHIMRFGHGHHMLPAPGV
jgi:hypothetical protein